MTIFNKAEIFFCENTVCEERRYSCGGGDGVVSLSVSQLSRHSHLTGARHNINVIGCACAL